MRPNNVKTQGKCPLSPNQDERHPRKIVSHSLARFSLRVQRSTRVYISLKPIYSLNHLRHITSRHCVTPATFTIQPVGNFVKIWSESSKHQVPGNLQRPILTVCLTFRIGGKSHGRCSNIFT